MEEKLPVRCPHCGQAWFPPPPTACPECSGATKAPEETPLTKAEKLLAELEAENIDPADHGLAAIMLYDYREHVARLRAEEAQAKIRCSLCGQAWCPPPTACPECSGRKKTRDFKDLAADELIANHLAVQEGRDLIDAASASRRDRGAREADAREAAMPAREDVPWQPSRVQPEPPAESGPSPKELRVGDSVVARVRLGGTSKGTLGRVIGQFYRGCRSDGEYLQVAFEGGTVDVFIDEARNFINKKWVAEQKAKGSAGTWHLARTSLTASCFWLYERKGALQVGDKVVLRRAVSRPVERFTYDTPAGTRGRVSATWWKETGSPDAQRLLRVEFVDGRSHIFADAPTHLRHSTSDLERLS